MRESCPGKGAADEILAQLLDCQACVVEGANVGCDDSTTARQAMCLSTASGASEHP